MQVKCIERVIVATPSVEDACSRWARGGFAVSAANREVDGICFRQMAAGAVEIDLAEVKGDADGPLAEVVSQAATRGGGIVGWTWGTEAIEERPGRLMRLPSNGSSVDANVISRNLPGVLTAALAVTPSVETRSAFHRTSLGSNPNTVDFLEHIVVMAPALEEAIAAQEAIGVPCKRIREVGNGMRQAFFKLEQTVIEVVGPTRDRPGGWGLAFMCSDIAKAVAVARENGLQPTEPKKAVQGGLIARIVDPLDGVAVAFMQAPG